MIEVIGLAILGFFISDWFKPIQWLKDELKVYEWPYIGTVLYCVKCSAFWLTLIVLQNIYLAAISAIIAYIIKFTVDYVESKYRNDQL
jgi:hypothetical protein